MVQWLGPGAFTAGGLESIPGQGTKIPQATWHDQQQKQSGKRSPADGPGQPSHKKGESF